MPSTLPVVDGFHEPLSLREFIRQYFAIHMISRSRCPSSVADAAVLNGNQTSCPRRIVAVPAAPYASFVYVSLGAPPPPPIVMGSTDMGDDAVPFENVKHRPTIHVSSIVSPHQPLAGKCLKHELWLLLFDVLGPRGTGFMLAHCAVVAQFAPEGGGLHIMGRSLSHMCMPSTAPHERKRPRCSMMHPGWAAPTEIGNKRRRMEVVQRSFAFRRRRVSMLGLPTQNVSRIPLLWASGGGLPIEASDADEFDALRRAASSPSGNRTVASHLIDIAVAKVEDARRNLAHQQAQGAQPIEDTLKQAGGFQGLTDDHIVFQIVHQHIRKLLVHQDDTATTAGHPLSIIDSIFPATIGQRGPSMGTEQHQQERPKKLLLFLVDLIASVVAQTALSNVRGASLACGGGGDAHSPVNGGQLQRLQPISIRSRASVAIVVRFLRRILSSFRWPIGGGETLSERQGVAAANQRFLSFWDRSVCSTRRRGGAANTKRNRSRRSRRSRRAQRFQHQCRQSANHAMLCLRQGNVHEASAVTNSSLAPLDALLLAIGQWLMFGRRGHFPLHLFADRVRVNQVPWLSRCQVRPLKKNCHDPKAVGVRNHTRGAHQQRMWLEFCKFFMEGPVPFLVRSAFRATWSPKAPTSILYFHRNLFARWEGQELDRVRAAQLPRCTGARAAASALQSIPMELAVVSRRSDVRLRALRSPLRRMEQLYSFHRMLPDGKKLRPVATIRYGTVGGLQSFARKWQRRRATKNQQRFRTVDAACRRRAARASSSYALPPNRSILRDCLSVLSAGARERQRGLGYCLVSHRRHEEEYAAWRAFVGSCRAMCRRSPEHACNEQEESPTVEIFVVRGDASRCFDRLPQDALVHAINTLVPHATYYRLMFSAIVPTVPGDYSLKIDATRMRRIQWTTVSTGADYGEGIVRDIPVGWIVSEDAAPLLSQESSNAVERLDGAYLRQVLRQHVEHHYAVVCGRLYEQRRGITQGSAVATILCDALLTDSVDRDLTIVLEHFDAVSTLMRRVDDVLVATTSRHASDACDAAVRCGWASESGYVRNSDKSHVVSSNGPVVWKHDVDSTSPAGGPAPSSSSSSSCSSGLLPPLTNWCGLIWNLKTLEFSIDWSRLLGDRALHACRLRPSLRPRTESDVILSALRVVGVLQIRTPLTLFCNFLNSRQRVLQTVCEMCLTFADSFVAKLVECAPFLRPHPRCLLRPLAVASSAFTRHLQKRDGELRDRGGKCAVSANELRFILVVAVLQTMHARRSHFLAKEGNRQFQLCCGVAVPKMWKPAFLRKLVSLLKTRVETTGRAISSQDAVPVGSTDAGAWRQDLLSSLQQARGALRLAAHEVK